MRQVVKSFAVMSFAVGALCLTAGSARASTATDGGVFIHGTGDYPGTFSCTGSGGSTHCSVPAAVTGYLTGSGDSSTGTPQEISIVAGSHPWAVVGYSGGSWRVFSEQYVPVPAALAQHKGSFWDSRSVPAS